MDKELDEAVNWLSALDIKSEYEATNKESILNYIDNSMSKGKINEVLNDLNSEYIEIEKDFDAIYKKENKDMQEFYTTRDLTTQLQMISWFEGILEEVLKKD